MTYSLLNKQGDKIGHYNKAKSSSPGSIAKKIAKQIYYHDKKNTRGVIEFIDNQTKKIYNYQYSISKLKKPIKKNVGDSVILIEYDIKVKRV